jgi:Kef-type K+ transport system membrane component KefB
MPLATVDPAPMLAIVAVAAIAGTVAALLSDRGVLVPAVVVELVLGVVIGPEVVGLEVTDTMTFLAALGLGLLFFFAGYEIDLRQIKGKPLRLAVLGWAMSLAIAYTVGGLLAWAGIVLSLVYTGSAMSTTAIGTLIPVLSDSGELRTRLGRYLLAAGAAGEFGPILLLTLVLSTQGALHNALILLGFVALAVTVAVLVVRSSGHVLPMLERTMEKSSQLAVRWIVMLVFALAVLAYELGLDLLLGGFAAGMITRLVLAQSEVREFDSKLTAVGFGFFIPFFFVVSGMQIDIDALFSSIGGVAKMLLFVVLFLVVRGAPALVLYRTVLDGSERLALALFCATQLPMVLAITTVAHETGHMRASTAASLVGAAVLSTLAFPMLGLRRRARAAADRTNGVMPVAAGGS